MPIGDLDVPVIGKNVVIAILVQSHILIATFILGASLIAPTAEYLGMVTMHASDRRLPCMGPVEVICPVAELLSIIAASCLRDDGPKGGRGSPG